MLKLCENKWSLHPRHKFTPTLLIGVGPRRQYVGGLKYEYRFYFFYF